MTTAILIPVDALPSLFDVTEDLDGLRSLQEAVGGHIECLPFPGRSDVVCYVNDEGKLQGLAVNRIATAVMLPILRANDFIAGPMVVIGHDGQGGHCELPQDLLKPTWTWLPPRDSA